MSDREQPEGAASDPAQVPVATLAEEGGASAEHTGEGADPAAADGVAGSRRARRRAKKAQRSKLRRRLTRTGLAVVGLVVVLVGSVAGYLYNRLNSLARVAVPNLTKAPAAGAPAGAQDILLVGSTSRCAVTPTKYLKNFVQQCKEGVNGVNSDVILILRLDPGHAPTLLSIPRDTFVPDARAGDLSNKVDAALADGPSQLVTAIQQDFGIPINHYVVLNFQTFANIVTALGGITMYFPTSLYDAQSGLDISHSGCLHISGLEALALVRSRHLQYHYDHKTHQWLGYDPTGDLGRIERVHIFLKVLGTQVAQRGLSNPLTDNKLLSALAPDLTIDTTFGTQEILSLLLDYHSKIGSVRDYTLPVIEDTQTYYYKGYNYGLVVLPTQPQDQATIAAFMGADPKGTNLKPSSISVSVLDGTSSASAAAATASALAADGYKISAGGARTSVGPTSETEVVYSGAAHLAQAERVLHSLAGTALLALGPTVGGADVSVITGSDLAVAPPTNAVAASTSVGAMASGDVLTALLTSVLTAATTSTSTSVNVGLTAPTSATPGIAPYDPRACRVKKT